MRHGRTAWNTQKRVMGWLDESIEPTSLGDAKAVARALAGEDVGSIVSSPLRRALATAAPLAALVGLEPRIDERFGEMHVGPWEGLSEEEVATQWPTEWQRWRRAVSNRRHGSVQPLTILPSSSSNVKCTGNPSVVLLLCSSSRSEITACPRLFQN